MSQQMHGKMKALLLAAGYGTRLRPLTAHLPKCLVTIHGQALLGIWLQRLSDAGYGPFLVNTHYRSAQVDAFLAASPYRAQVNVKHEATLLGTAATLIANLDFFDGADGLLLHADNYCLADFQAFAAAHRQRPAGCVMSMMTFRSDTPTSCGIVTLDAHNVVIDFAEKPARPNGNLANGAIYILSAELIASLRMQAQQGQIISDFSTEVLPTLLGRIYAYETTATLIDIGTPASYAAANAHHA